MRFIDQSYIDSEPFLDVVKALLVSGEVLTSDWSSSDFEVKCDQWTNTNAGKTIVKSFSIENTQYSTLQQQFQLTCQYATCSNTQGLIIDGLDPSDTLGEIVLDNIVYELVGLTNTVTLPIPKKYCDAHTEIIVIEAIQLLVEGQAPTLLTESQLARTYGVTISRESMQINVKDESLHLHTIELKITTSITEEASYATSIRQKIIFKVPDCELTQVDIDKAERQQIELTVEQGGEDLTKSLKETLSKARETMKAKIVKYCGALTVQYVDQDKLYPFLDVDLDTEEAKLSADLLFKTGVYEKAFIRYTYSKGDNLRLVVPIVAEIEPCKILSVKFEQPRTAIEYILCENELKVQIPRVLTKPDCGVDPDINSYVLTAKSKVPQDKQIEEFIWFDLYEKVIVVRYSEDLSLYKQSFSASLLVYAESRLEAKLEFSVSFSSLGPKLG